MHPIKLAYFTCAAALAGIASGAGAELARAIGVGKTGMVRGRFVFVAYEKERFKGRGFYYRQDDYAMDRCYNLGPREDDVIASMSTGLSPWCVTFFDAADCDKPLFYIGNNTDAAWLDFGSRMISSFKYRGFEAGTLERPEDCLSESGL